MDMRMKSCGFAESLHDRDHTGPEANFFERGGAHELSNRLVSAAGELAEELAMMEEVEAEHLGDGENPHRV
jgi:hypothetical protein